MNDRSNPANEPAHAATERRLFVGLVALLAAATIAPIWVARYLPLLDVPNHLSAVAVWHYYDDPSWNFAQHYQLNLVPLPYWAHYYTVHLLTYVTRSVEVANKIFLSGYALAVPAGAFAFCRRFDRSPWLTLLSFPLVWNFNLADGFVAYCAGFAAVPLALVLVDRYAERPTWPGALAVVVVGSLTYFFHLLAYALFLVCAGLIVLVQRRALSPRLLIARSLPVLSCAGVGLWALRRANSMGFRKVTGTHRQWVRDGLDTTLTQVPERLFNFVPGHADEWMIVTLAAVWLTLAITDARRRDLEPPARHGAGHRWGVELCLLGALVLFVVLPRSMKQPFYWHLINGRFVVALAFFALLSLRGAIGGRRRWLLLPVVVAHLAYMGAICRAFVRFNRNAAGFEALVDRIPRDQEVLTLILRPMGDVNVNVSAFNQFPSYVQLRHGGYNFYNFAEGFPLKYKHKLPAPSWSHAETFNWETHSRGWGYFLTFREGWEAAPMKVPLATGKVELVGESGVWKLYRKLVKDPDFDGTTLAKPRQ
jgi:hypothetical protein